MHVAVFVWAWAWARESRERERVSELYECGCIALECTVMFVHTHLRAHTLVCTLIIVTHNTKPSSSLAWISRVWLGNTLHVNCCVVQFHWVEIFQISMYSLCKSWFTSLDKVEHIIALRTFGFSHVCICMQMNYLALKYIFRGEEGNKWSIGCSTGTNPICIWESPKMLALHSCCMFTSLCFPSKRSTECSGNSFWELSTQLFCDYIFCVAICSR